LLLDLEVFAASWGPAVKAVILAGGRGSRISEESHLRPKPMIEIGGRPIRWHFMKIYAARAVTDFVICLGYFGYMIKEFFANYVLHGSDVTAGIAANRIEYHESTAEPWRVALIETGLETQTGDRLKRIAPDLGRGVRWNHPAFSIAWPLDPVITAERDAAYPDFAP
jgi:glucose-1-phosphate cytidylyltransferase